MPAPKDPRTAGRSYAKAGAPPPMQTGPKGPMARGATQMDRSRTESGGPNHLAVGGMKPSAKQK